MKAFLWQLKRIRRIRESLSCRLWLMAHGSWLMAHGSCPCEARVVGETRCVALYSVCRMTPRGTAPRPTFQPWRTHCGPFRPAFDSNHGKHLPNSCLDNERDNWITQSQVTQHKRSRERAFQTRRVCRFGQSLPSPHLRTFPICLSSSGGADGPSQDGKRAHILGRYLHVVPRTSVDRFQGITTQGVSFQVGRQVRWPCFSFAKKGLPESRRGGSR